MLAASAHTIAGECPGAVAKSGHRTPQDFEPPSGKIKDGIEQEWGSLDDFIAKFNPTTAAVQVCFSSSHSMSIRGASCTQSADH